MSNTGPPVVPPNQGDRPTGAPPPPPPLVQFPPQPPPPWLLELQKALPTFTYATERFKQEESENVKKISQAEEAKAEALKRVQELENLKSKYEAQLATRSSEEALARARAWPNDIREWQTLRQSFANSPHKNYGGTRGDSAFINWALAIMEIASAATVIYFSHRFLAAYGEFKGKSAQNFTKAYYCCQYLLGLSILTTALLTFYVLWVFADARHPMRKAWMVMGQERNGKEPSGKHPDGVFVGFSKGFKDAQGREVRRPGLATTSFETIHRFTTNRLFAERRHVKTMLIIYLVLFVLWVVPFLIVTLMDGYITYRRNKKNHNVNVAELCGIEKTSTICWHLAKAGITAGAVTAFLLFNIIATLIAMVARPTLTTIPKDGPISKYVA